MKRLAFDIDGCVINLQDSLKYYFKKMYEIDLPEVAFSRWSIEEVTNIPYEKVLACVNTCIEDIYRQDMYPGSYQFLNEYQRKTNDKLLFVTNRWDMKNTFRLLDRWFLNTPYDVKFVESRRMIENGVGYLGGSKIDILKKEKIDVYIEDRIENAEEIASAGIFVILLERPWNQFGSRGSNTLVRVKDWAELEEVYNRLEEVNLGEEHECHYCGKKATIFDRDPFTEEIWNDVTDEGNPEEWWCEDCYQQRLDDI